MRTRKHTIPPDLTAARKAFERWRATRTQWAIPEPLWATAVALARKHGVHRTSRELRLNYERLRQRVGDSPSKTALPGRLPTFAEVVPGERTASVAPVAAPAGGECVIELENARGDRARVRVRGVPDLAALAASLWGNASR
jgi:hypothetical protein